MCSTCNVKRLLMTINQFHVLMYKISIDFWDRFSWLLDSCMCVFDLIQEYFESPGSSDPNNRAYLLFWCRIQTYLQSTRPIIDLYEKQGKVHTLDASRSVNEVSKRHGLKGTELKSLSSHSSAKGETVCRSTHLCLLTNSSEAPGCSDHKYDVEL